MRGLDTTPSAADYALTCEGETCVTVSAQRRACVRLIGSAVLLFCLGLPLQTAWGQAAPASAPAAGISRLGVRMSNPATVGSVGGVLYALDQSGRAVTDLNSSVLQATVDGKPTQVSLTGGRPSIALAAAFMLDSSASAQVRDAVANAFANSVQGLDARRDSVAIASTAQGTPWEQARFTTSADELRTGLNAVIQSPPDDNQATLAQIAGILRALAGQTADTRVLLLFVNRPLASAASVNASLGAVRTFAADNGIQVSIVALPGVGGQGPSEALAEATPGGRVEYVLNATNTDDIGRRISLLLGSVYGARHFDLAPQIEGSHMLSIGAPGVTLQATAPFSVTGRAVQVASLQTAAGPLQASTAITQPTWVQAVPADNLPIDSVEWGVDGHVTQATSDPWALLLDPEQLGEGSHDISARIVSQGRAGPFLTNSISVPFDFARDARNFLRSWGVIALLVIAEIIIIALFIRMAPAARGALGKANDFAPLLRRNALTGAYVAPDVIEFPTRGKLRLGYHPPYMDNYVGSREFAVLPYRDIRGDSDAVNDLSRHAAVIWRDGKTNDCFIQLGWTGSGETVKPKAQSQVFHLGRPQDATSAPFRLMHHDVVRLGTQVEFVFSQVGLADKSTPETRKVSPFDLRTAAPARMTVLEESGADTIPGTESIGSELVGGQRAGGQPSGGQPTRGQQQQQAGPRPAAGGEVQAEEG